MTFKYLFLKLLVATNGYSNILDFKEKLFFKEYLHKKSGYKVIVVKEAQGNVIPLCDVTKISANDTLSWCKNQQTESFTLHFLVPNNKKRTKTNESDFSHARYHINIFIQNKLSLKSYTSLNFPIGKQLSFIM